MKVRSPQPPKSDDLWDGHSDGAIYMCSPPGSSKGYDFWAATGPAAPDPEVLARQAVASMNLLPIRIGMVPQPRPGKVGLVGLPVWLWVDEPSAQTFGPISRTASSAGFSVTARARVERVRWEMGDGGVVSCSGRGTRYEDRFGATRSPTCGYAGYSADGVYTVRATSYWVVSWAGLGQTGTIRFSLLRSARVTIGELQVVNR